MTTIQPLLALEFRNPAMLWGLLLAGLPLLLHLLFRRTQHIEPWGAMQFLQAAYRRRRQRLRLESLAQLAIRSSLLGVIVLAAAEPHLASTATVNSTNRPVHRLVIADTSLSMQATDGLRTAADGLATALSQLAQQAQPGDSFQLLQTSLHGERIIIRSPAFDTAAVSREFELLEPTFDKGALLDCLQEAWLLLQTAPPEALKEVVVVSDMQAAEWRNEPEAMNTGLKAAFSKLAQAARLTLLDVAVEALDNASVTELQLVRPWTFAGQSCQLQVTIDQGGRADAIPLDVRVDGAPHSQVQVAMQAGSGQGTIPVMFLTPGEHIVTVSIPDDGLQPDNSRSIAVQVVRSVKVLLVGQPAAAATSSGADYLALALSVADGSGSIGGERNLPARFEVSSITPGQLSARDLSEFDCVVLREPDAIQLPDARSLAEFARLGGGLIIVPEGQSNLAAINNVLVNETKLCPIRYEEEAGSVVELDTPLFFQAPPASHPILKPFEGYQDAGLQTTRVYKYFHCEPAGPAMDSIVRLSNGAPILVEQAVESGRVLALTVPLDAQWSSWVVWPSFVPMLHEAVLYSAAGRTARWALTVGDDVPISPGGSVADVLIPPDGQQVRLIPGDENRSRTDSVATHLPGVYRIVNSTLNTAESLTVSVPASETELLTIPESELRNTVLQGLPVRWSTSGRMLDRSMRDHDGESQSTPGEESQWLLFLAGLLLAADILLSHRFLWLSAIVLQLLLAGLAIWLLNISPFAVGYGLAVMNGCGLILWRIRTAIERPRGTQRRA